MAAGGADMAGVGGDMAAAPVPDGGTLLADTGFRPAPNGFAFQNYGPDFMNNDILADDLRRLFGDAVCQSVVNNSCQLSGPMEQNRQQLVKLVAGGHCEGFAVLSLLMYSGLTKPSDFGNGANAASDLMLAGNDKLQRELAYWWATQLFEPVSMNKLLGAPNTVIDAFIQGVKAKTDSYSLLFFKRDGKGGHAVTPYAVRDNGGGKYSLLIYDNNFPGKERSVEIDRNANSWTYNTAADPNQPAENYDGDATTKSIGIVPTSKRQGQLVCPVCGMAAMTGPPMMTTGALMISGAGSVLATDDNGMKAGTMNGAIVDTIPGASVTPVLSGIDPFTDPQSPVFVLPTGSGYTISIDGTGMGAASPTDVRLNLPGYSLGVLGVNLDPGQVDTLRISKLADEVNYTTTGMETPTLELAIATPTASWQFLITAAGTMAGQKVDLKIDLANQKLRVENNNMNGMASFDIEIHRTDASGEVVFKHSANSETATDAVYLDYGAWGGDGTPMALELDMGDNGTVDSTVMLSDEP